MFCPYEGRPYKGKLTVFWGEGDMDASDNDGFLLLEDGTFRVRYQGATTTADVSDPAVCGIPEDLAHVIATVRDSYAYLLR